MLRIVGDNDGLGDAEMIQVGAKGSNVMQIQTILTGNGYPTGGIDGIFGEKTKTAVISFQSAQGLTPDGIIGPQTWGALMKLAAVHGTSSAAQTVQMPKAAPAPASAPTVPWSTYLPFLLLAGMVYVMWDDK